MTVWRTLRCPMTTRAASNGVVTQRSGRGPRARLDADELRVLADADRGRAGSAAEARDVLVDDVQVSAVQLTADGVRDERLEQRVGVLARLDRLVGPARAR